MNLIRYPALAAAVLMLTACNTSSGPGARLGTIAGALGGGIIGNQFGSGRGRVAATAVGAVVGGIIGHEIGRSLDEADRRAAAEAEYRALEYGAPESETSWRNPKSGKHGLIKPGKPYVTNELNCRDYTHTIYIDGKPETVRGTACRQADGTWKTRKG